MSLIFHAWQTERSTVWQNAGSILCGRGEIVNAPAREAGGRESIGGASPFVRTNFRRVVAEARKREDGVGLGLAKAEQRGCPLGQRYEQCIHTSLRNSRAKAHAGASPVPSTTFWPIRISASPPVFQAGAAGAAPAWAANFCRRPALEAPFPFIVQKPGRERAKLEIGVQVLVKGPCLAEHGES